LQSEAEHSPISNGCVRPITLLSSPAEKLIYLTIKNFLAGLPVLNEEQNEISLILVQMEPKEKLCTTAVYDLIEIGGLRRKPLRDLPG
jgi:hypothetical protein